MRLSFTSVCLLLGPLSLPAEDAGELFLNQVQPILKRECLGCHGDGQILGNLDLRTREAMLKGGPRGSALAPGNAAASLLYQLLNGRDKLQMPPGKPLPPDAMAAFKAWIDAGAPWPAARSKPWSYQPEDLWAFQPVSKPKPPIATRNPVDAFILEKLSQNGLKPAPPADKRTLIRRATIDLTGLPPTPEEVDAFLKDTSPDAWGRLIERLLASPRYGERWGRHWLDVVRYADSGGYSNDFERPNAWRYRDYVIRSFNHDKPYDRFVREQIAGDEIDPDNPEAILATGFLRSGPWEHTGMSVEAVTRQMFLDDVTSAIGAAFLGLTVGCARCHDHKFDPIPTRDYYRMQAVFAATEFARPSIPFLEDENTAGLASGKARMAEIARRTKSNLDSFDDRVKQYLLKKHGAARLEDLPPETIQNAVREKEGITAEEYEEYKLYQKHMQLYRESLDRFEPKAFAVSSGPLDGFTDGGPNLRYPPLARYKAPEVHILPGGNIQSPAAAVTPGALSIIAGQSRLPAPDIPETVAGRRTALAGWITDPRNPLTARVMVNRIWQYHFGKGLAADASNFGKMGSKPTHPELLDLLASYFMDNGWSVKAMHRLIMLSDAYQRASSHPDIETVIAKDAGNKLLACVSPRRVEAEVLRDAILAVSGELSLESGGPGVFPQINEDVARQPLHRMGSLAPAYHPDATKRLRNRRTIYTFQQRSLVDPMIEVFNGPSLDLSCERREFSTVPTQAFSLFNGQFVHDMALAFAVRLEKEAPDARGRIERAFRLAYGRVPEPREMQLALAHLEKQTRHHRAMPPPARPRKKPVVHTITSELTGEKFEFLQEQDPAEYEENVHPSGVSPQTRALADFALALLNSSEFVYVY
ncbi:MAG: PSD1 domain-containing protein [Acidobacteria bacterium]|nr:PSD1 domain-containing protein [Acidobacteriota bacterium]